MTVLAFDGVTLAADKQVTSGNATSTVTKIFRVGSSLVGLVGNMAIAMELLTWFRNGAIAEHYPESNRDPNECATLVTIRPDGTVWEYWNSPEPFQNEDKFCAFGCGSEGAMVAMACGKSAREAIELVSLYNAGCGNGVDALALAGTH